MKRPTLYHKTVYRQLIRTLVKKSEWACNRTSTIPGETYYYHDETRFYIFPNSNYSVGRGSTNNNNIFGEPHPFWKSFISSYSADTIPCRTIRKIVKRKIQKIQKYQEIQYEIQKLTNFIG
jgi:hypothetical protein